MLITEEMQLGRARNAVLAYFEQRLSVPKIYLNADWTGAHVDVLAIDREGVGDVHAVFLFARPYFDDGSLNLLDQAEMIDELMDRFESVVAQYKYVGVVDANPQRATEPFSVSDPMMERSYAPDGIGRVGFLTISVPLAAEGELTAKIVYKPERFRAAVARLADDYIEKHMADWEFRT